MKYIITLDIGTTEVKVGLFDQSLNTIGMVNEEYSIESPQSNFFEVPPRTYFDKTISGIKEVLRRSKISPADVSVISVTSQGETLVPMDATGTELHNAIVWFDGRAEEEAVYINKLLGKQNIYEKTGIGDITGATPISKILWFKTNLPEIYEKTHKFLLVLDYVIFQLTGEYFTDSSVSSSTGYVDINRDCLWEEAIRTIGLKEDLFPGILKTGSVLNKIKSSIAAELGFSENTRICFAGMDQMSAAVGCGNLHENIVSETTGTALVISATLKTANYSMEGRPYITKHYGDQYLLMPFCPNAAIIQKWFKDEFCRDMLPVLENTEKSIYEILETMAEESMPGCNGLVVLPHFSGKYAPDCNMNAKGVFYGITLETKRTDFIRAIYESIAFMLRENLEALISQGISIFEIRSTGGGSKSGCWNKIKADVTGYRIITMSEVENTSLGAAMIGSVGAGFYQSINDAEECIIIKNTYISSKNANYEENYKQYKEIYNKLFD